MRTSEALTYYADHPVEYVEDIIQVKPDPQQCQILESVARNPMTSVRSGHGVGKSAVEAWVILWYLTTRPFPKIPCTAPTQHQLFDILWAEVSKWIRNNPLLKKELVWTAGKVYMKGHPEEWFAVARTASKPDALQGFHADNVLYIIDEASGVDDRIFEPVLGSLSTAGARLLMCGNPTQLSGFFFDSHNKNRAMYATYHIDARESSRVSPDYVQTIINMYGENSDVFRVRVSGDFPLSEDDICIPLPVAMKSVETEYHPRVRPLILSIGCDVARFGADKTVISFRVDEKVEFYKKTVGQDTMRTADDIAMLGLKLVSQYHLKAPTANTPGDEPIPVKIDDSGVGGGVVDRLRQMKRNDPDRFWWLEIYPVHFGQRIHHKFYDDTTTYMMYTLKHLLQPYDENGQAKDVEVILPDDDALISQLSVRKYNMTENGKIRVESKKVMKERGLSSPDEADSVLLTCLPVRRPKKRMGGS